MPDTEFVVNRWRRYGHDRLYVNSASAGPLGWIDLTSNETHAAAPEHLAAIHRARAEWSAQLTDQSATPLPLRQQESCPTEDLHRASPVAEEPPKPAEVAAATVQRAGAGQLAPADGADLTSNRPGESLRAEAESLRAAAPVSTFLTRLFRLHTPERAWRVGAVGEERVAVRLARLARHDPRWRVLHSIRVGSRGADIDHLVVGPGGVFTLNSKNHPGASLWVGGDAFMVDGLRVPYVHKSRAEARRAARLLTVASGAPISVTGVIVVVGANRLTIKTPPADVAVVSRRHIGRWLLGHPPVLDDHSLARIWEAACRSHTWLGRPGPVDRTSWTHPSEWSLGDSNP